MQESNDSQEHVLITQTKILNHQYFGKQSYENKKLLLIAYTAFAILYEGLLVRNLIDSCLF
jgi:hypothetical protein